MGQKGWLIMPSLRSSIRKRRQAEETESNPVEQNPVEEAAKEAIQKQLDEQPEPVEPKPDQMQRWAEKNSAISWTLPKSLRCRPRMLKRRSRGTHSGAPPISLPSKTNSDRSDKKR